MESWDVLVHLFPKKRYRDKIRIELCSGVSSTLKMFDSVRIKMEIKMGLKFLGFSCSESSSLGLAI